MTLASQMHDGWKLFVLTSWNKEHYLHVES